MDSEYLLYTELRELRQEQQDQHKAVMSKLEGVIETQGDHETRLVVLENTRRNMRWAVGTVVVAALTGVVDYFKNHFRP